MNTVVYEGNLDKKISNDVGYNLPNIEIVETEYLEQDCEIGGIYNGEVNMVVHKVATGVKLNLPDNIFAIVKPRSSAIERGYIVIEGVIDPGYRGEVFINVIQLRQAVIDDFFDKALAQLVFFERPNLRLVKGIVTEDTERGANGFGHTDEL